MTENVDAGTGTVDDTTVAGGTGAGGDGGAGDAGGDPSGPLDLASVAAQFDAEAVGGGDDAAGGEGSGDGKGGADGQPPSSDPFDEYVQQNYQGNRAAAVAGLYESRQEQKRLAAEIELLKRERQQAPRDQEAEIKALRASDPDIQA